jgi:hypothetical protein
MKCVVCRAVCSHIEEYIVQTKTWSINDTTCDLPVKKILLPSRNDLRDNPSDQILDHGLRF